MVRQKVLAYRDFPRGHMETGNYCAHNESRDELLSESVALASERLEPVQFLALLLNGPATNRHSAVWMKSLAGAGEWPRLFAFDFAYLDAEQRIVAAGSVGPGTEFPPLPEGVTSVLFLPDHRLEETGSARGNVIRICAEERAAAEAEPAMPSSSGPREANMEAQPSQNQPEEAAHSWQATRLSEYVFEPFAGSLVYLPDPAPFDAQGSERFLTPKIAARGFDAASVSEPIEEPVEEQNAEAVAAAPVLPEPEDVEEEPAEIAPLQDASTTENGPGPEVPRFFTPEKIRFYDPAASVHVRPESETKQEAGTPRSGELPPALKAAILLMDEQLRREKEQKESRKKKDKAPGEKARKAPARRRARPVEDQKIEAAANEQEPAPAPLEQPVAETGLVKGTEETLPPVSLQAAPEVTELPVEVPPNPESQLEPEPEIIGAPADEVEVSPTAAFEETPAVQRTEPEIEEVEPEETVALSMGQGIDTQQPTPVMEATQAAEPPLPQIEDRPRETTGTEPVSETPSEKKKEKLSIGLRLSRWLVGEQGSQRRKSERVALPGLVAFYWSGGSPKPHEVVNISKNGFYLRTKELWSPETLLRMTLQRPNETEAEMKHSISILARVVRIDEGGVGHEFVTSEALLNRRTYEILPEQTTSRKELEAFLGIDEKRH